MSSTLIGAAEEGRIAISLMTSSPSLEISGFESVTTWGYPICCYVDTQTFLACPKKNKSTFNLSSTELRLGLPGSRSPSGRLDEKPLFPLLPMKDSTYLSSQKAVVSGNREGFRRHGWVFRGKSTVYNEGNWMFLASWSRLKLAQSGTRKTTCCRLAANKVIPKNTLATTTKTSEEVDGKPGPALYVKVAWMAPLFAKELSLSLEKMFICFIIESKHRDLLHGSEYVLAYEDKDGDWMQVGDVPW
ncbi:hypothetical protein MKW92_052847, partial [Papaver armeniacum]